MGRGKREEMISPFPSSHRPPRTFYFYDYYYFYRDTRRKPLRRRESPNHSLYASPAVCPRLKNQAVRGETYIIGGSYNLPTYIIHSQSDPEGAQWVLAIRIINKFNADLCLKRMRKSQPISNRSNHFKPEHDFLLENRRFIKQIDRINLCKPCVRVGS